MSLDLNEFLADDDYIEYGDEKFVVTAKVNRDFYNKFSEIINRTAMIKKESMTNKDLHNMIRDAKKITIDLLSIKNEPKKVKKFIDNLNVNLFVKVFNFIGEYLANSITDKKKID